MGCIKTYTGVMFDPLNPIADLISITDIAHALSMLCRANGHFKSFYSVGQHSINCMREALARGCSKRVQLACLLHDASEAYISDITRPVKAELPGYVKIEEPLQNMIWRKWLDKPLSKEEKNQVFQIDNDMLAHEFLSLMDTQLTDTLPALNSRPVFEFRGFATCEQDFIRHFRHLTSEKEVYFTVGIDWMAPYWLAVELRGTTLSSRRFTHISEACAAYEGADAILIDIPIGLPENVKEDFMRPDKALREKLPVKRKPSVFPVPCRQAIYAASEAEAKRINADVLHRGLSRQAYGFSKMIQQVDTFLQKTPTWKNVLLESHPEAAFQFLNGDAGLQHSKHSEAGIAERSAILRNHGIYPDSLLSDVSPKQRADVLDALCLAVSAQQGCRNGFITIPENPAYDRQGLKMQMCFGKVDYVFSEP